MLLGVCASLLLASPASAAFSPPELFVRLQRADITHEPASDWIPLAAAPRLDYIGGFQIGYRLQRTGVNGNFQTAALSITGVPDGQPTQPSNTPPYCVGKNGAEGRSRRSGARSSSRATGRTRSRCRSATRSEPAAWAGRRPPPHRSPSTSMWRRNWPGRLRVPREAAPRRPVRRHPRGRSAGWLRRQQLRAGCHGPA